MFSVVDHKEGKNTIFCLLNHIFSPDSKHLAYLAVKGEKYLSSWMVRKANIMIPHMSQSSSVRIASDVITAETGGKTHTVIDGQEGMRYYQIGALLIFSPDSKHIVYIATDTDGKVFPVVDGKEGKRY